MGKKIPPVEATVVIVALNQATKTIKCFQSIRANCPLSHEIIWVDNGSKADEFALTKRAATRPRMRTKLIKFRNNGGFVKGVNSAIPEIHKESKYVILLNNDCEVGHRTFSKLIKPLIHDPKIGATSCITQSRISWQEAKNLNRRWPDLKVPEFKGNISDHTKKLEKQFDGKAIDVGALNLSFFCVAFRKEVFVNELHGLEEDFGLGLGDDDFACHKLRHIGYRLYLVLDAFVYHHHRTTFNALRLDVSSIQHRNFKTLKRKVKELARNTSSSK